MAWTAEAAQPGWLARATVRRPGVAEAACWLAAAGLLAVMVGWPSLGSSHYEAIERQAAAALARRDPPPSPGLEGAPTLRLSASATP